MTFDAQSLITFAVVLAAVSYLGWRGVRLVRAKKAGGCGSACGDCPSSAGEKQDLVQITPGKFP
jgi:hypothetical protein